MNLSERARGRTISGTIRIRLIPQGKSQEYGSTDDACEIGIGLIREAAQVLVAAAEREGFLVELDYKQTVY